MLSPEHSCHCHTGSHVASSLSPVTPSRVRTHRDVQWEGAEDQHKSPCWKHPSIFTLPPSQRQPCASALLAVGSSRLAKPSPPGTPVCVSLSWFIFGSRHSTPATPSSFPRPLKMSSEAGENKAALLSSTSTARTKAVVSSQDAGETTAGAGGDKAERHH